ncbi:MAG: hypothetical protein Q7S31_03705 [bacterium]|nr:hypothetical protein [bacterium]
MIIESRWGSFIIINSFKEGIVNLLSGVKKEVWTTAVALSAIALLAGARNDAPSQVINKAVAVAYAAQDEEPMIDEVSPTTIYKAFIPFVAKGWPDYFRMIVANYNAAAFVDDRNSQHMYDGCANFNPGLPCVWYDKRLNIDTPGVPLPSASQCSPIMMWLNEAESGPDYVDPVAAANKSQTLFPALEAICGAGTDIFVGGFIQAGGGPLAVAWKNSYIQAGGLLDLEPGETGGWHFHYYEGPNSWGGLPAAKANFESIFGTKTVLSEWGAIVNYPTATAAQLAGARALMEYVRDNPPGQGEAYFEDVDYPGDNWPGAGLSTALLDSAGSNPNRTELGCTFSDVFGIDSCNLSP